MLTVESVPLSQAQGGIATYQFIVSVSEYLVTTVQAVGATTSLSLLDAQGHIAMPSDGQSAGNPNDVIDTYIPPGMYSLQVRATGGHIQFYPTTAGRESVELVSFSLSIVGLMVVPFSYVIPVLRLVSLHETWLPLVATLMTLTVDVSGEEEGHGPAESEELSVSANPPGTGSHWGKVHRLKGTPVVGQRPTRRRRPTKQDWESPVRCRRRSHRGSGSCWSHEALEEFRRANPEGIWGPLGRPRRWNGPSRSPRRARGPRTARRDRSRLPIGCRSVKSPLKRIGRTHRSGAKPPTG